MPAIFAKFVRWRTRACFGASPADKVRKEQRAEEARVAEGGARARARARATTGGPAPVMRAATTIENSVRKMVEIHQKLSRPVTAMPSLSVRGAR